MLILVLLGLECKGSKQHQSCLGYQPSVTVSSRKERLAIVDTFVAKFLQNEVQRMDAGRFLPDDIPCCFTSHVLLLCCIMGAPRDSFKEASTSDGYW